MTGTLARFAPTEVFNSFWYFASERQRMYLRRVEQCPAPWSCDEILNTYRFTNVYRASDRVSQYLLTHVIYDGARRRAVDDVLRILLFKLFNRVGTWQLLTDALGDITADSFNERDAAAVLDDGIARGRKVYSAAYIIPPVPGTEGRKHRGHLRLLREQLTTGGLERLLQAQSLQGLVADLRTWPGLGPFLAYQLAIDLNYGPHLQFDEDDFVLAGPGARDGLSKCFSDARTVSPESLIRTVAETQHESFASRGLEFGGLWGRPMKLIDVQNVFCEISKYARAAHPDVAGVAGRTRIKQRFAPAGPLPLPAFPPHWRVAIPRIPQTEQRVDAWGQERLWDTPHDLVAGTPPGVTVRARSTTASHVRGVSKA